MGVSFTNDNIDELLTSQVDGENKDMDTSGKIDELLKKNSILMKKFRSEMLTKQLYRARLKSLEVPSSTYTKVTASLERLIQDAKYSYNVKPHPIQNSTSFFEYLITVLTSPLRIGRAAVPAYSLGIVIILIIASAGFFLSQQSNTPLNPYIAAGSEKSVMVQAVNNFHKVLKGEIQPQIHTSDVNEVKRYIRDRVSFEPYVPKIDDYVLAGAVCNEYDGQKLVHIIYTSGDDILYIYETAAISLNHKRLELPDPVTSEIIKEKFYMCDQIDRHNCTMTLWHTGDVLCASVTTMPKQKMYSTFTGFYK